jgi:hypothetical protein
MSSALMGARNYMIFICFFGGGTRNRTEVHGFAGRCITTLPFRQRISNDKGKRLKQPLPF